MAGENGQQTGGTERRVPHLTAQSDATEVYMQTNDQSLNRGHVYCSTLLHNVDNHLLSTSLLSPSET